MAAINSVTEGQTPPTRSFAEALSSAPTASLHVKNPATVLSFEDAISGSHKGFPSLLFDDKHVTDLSHAFHWTLVGKFSQGFNKVDPNLGRPSVENLEKYFRTLDLKSDFSLGLLDNRHLLIRLSSEADYLRLYSRTVWYVAKVTMRIFKWSPYFNVNRETSLVPVWVSLPRLPVIFFAKPALFRIATLIGTPLRLDAATASLKRPGVARLQIKIDLLKERPPQIWIGMGSVTGFWQIVEYEYVPEYCTHCWHVGHVETLCTVYNPALKVTGSGVQKDSQQVQRPNQLHPKNPPSKKVYVVRQNPVVQQILPYNASENQALPLQTDHTPIASVTVQGIVHSTGLPIVADAPSVEHLQTTIEDTSTLTVVPNAQQAVVEVAKNNGTPSLQEAQVLVTGTNPPAARTVSTSTLHTATLIPESQPQPNKLIAVTPYPPVLTGDILQKRVEPHKTGPPNLLQTVDVEAFGSLISTTDKNKHLAVVSSDPLSVDSNDGIRVVAELGDTSVLASEQQGTPSTPTRSDLLTPMPLAEASPSTGREGNNSSSQGTVLNPNAESFQFPTLTEAYSTPQKARTSSFQPLIPLAQATRYEDSNYRYDSHESDRLEEEEDDVDDYYDITDGSEDTIRRKRQGRRKSRTLAPTHSATKEILQEQSRILGSKITKRGRPPGSRNRTFFDVVRTMETRSSKSISN